MAGAMLDARVDAVRHFNRFYTRKIGVLQQGLLQSRFSLTEVRVLYELAHRRKPTASDLRRELALDGGYLSRMLRSFERRGLVRRKASQADARENLLELTPRGRKSFAVLNARAQDEVRAMLRNLSPTNQTRLVQAMQTVEGVLAPGTNGNSSRQPAYTLRPPRPGDMGWVVHRHGALYAQEYRYDERFEALVAEIVAHFVQHFDRKRERCWIAEMKGEIVGSVFLVKKSDSVSKLRLLFVEPQARGLGIGRRLVDECVRFARQADYKKMTLWTQSELHVARHLYKQAGFRVVGRKRHSDFGKPSVAEVWDLNL
jgi:DNA-binding MarR family transcriptional regulator/GNAT superfamily N-acetyltransferase